jgi:hypothetical protein
MAAPISLDAKPKSAEFLRNGLINYPNAPDISSAREVKKKTSVETVANPALPMIVAEFANSNRIGSAQMELSPPAGGEPDGARLKDELRRLPLGAEVGEDCVGQATMGGVDGRTSGEPGMPAGPAMGGSLSIDPFVLMAIMVADQDTDVALKNMASECRLAATENIQKEIEEGGELKAASAFVSSVVQGAFEVAGSVKTIKGLGQEEDSIKNNLKPAAEMRELNRKTELSGADEALDGEGEMAVSERNAQRELRAQELTQNHEAEKIGAQRKEAVGTALHGIGAASAKFVDGMFEIPLSGIQSDQKLTENTQTTMQESLDEATQSMRTLREGIIKTISSAEDARNANASTISSMIGNLRV